MTYYNQGRIYLKTPLILKHIVGIKAEIPSQFIPTNIYVCIKQYNKIIDITMNKVIKLFINIKLHILQTFLIISSYQYHYVIVN